MEISGKIITVCMPKSGISQKTGNSWISQDFVIETTDEQPQKIVFNIFGEDKINNCELKLGDDVTVSLNFNAKEYNGRWFNSVNLIEVKKTKKTNKAKAKKSNPEDELPF